MNLEISNYEAAANSLDRNVQSMVWRRRDLFTDSRYEYFLATTSTASP
jgi:hypothetical protein